MRNSYFYAVHDRRIKDVHASVDFVRDEFGRLFHELLYPPFFAVDHDTIFGWFLYFSYLSNRSNVQSPSSKYRKGLKSQMLTTMVPSFPCALWKSTISLKGKSQMTSELRTKKGSSDEVRMSFAKANGPAVPRGSDSCENDRVMPIYTTKE